MLIVANLQHPTVNSISRLVDIFTAVRPTDARRVRTPREEARHCDDECQWEGPSTVNPCSRDRSKGLRKNTVTVQYDLPRI